MQLIKPPALAPGDSVALIAPASRPTQVGRFVLACNQLRALGFNPILAPNVGAVYGYLAGTDEQRLADFHWAWSHPAVRAVLCLRGGTGSARLLPDIDFALIRRNPKVFVGYSDITALHLAISRAAGLVTFHGPMFTMPPQNRYTPDSWLHALTTTAPLGALGDPDLPASGWVYPPYRAIIAPGEAVGPLVGGNITLIRQLMGSPWEIDTAGKIVVLEDVDEEPYAIDRMLTQLRQAGKLSAAAGFVIGACTNCESQGTYADGWGLEDVLRDQLAGLGKPVIYGLRFGHTDEQLTLPLGVQTRLIAYPDNVQLIIEEAATT